MDAEAFGHHPHPFFTELNTMGAPEAFTATAEVVRYLGAHPVLVDVDPITLNLEASAIEAAITARRSAASTPSVLVR